MNQTIQVHPSSLAISPPGQAADRRGEILAAIFRMLDQAKIRYCVPHGHEFLPAVVHAEVGLIVEQSALPDRLASLLQKNAAAIGAQVVRWRDDRAQSIVLADTLDPASPRMLELRIMPDFERANRVFYRGDELLDSRFIRRGMWIPAAEIEFGCILCDRIASAELSDDRARRLSALYAQSPLACEQQTTRFLSASCAIAICLAAECGDWTVVKNALPQLRTHLLANTADHFGIVRRRIDAWARRILRKIIPPRRVHALSWDSGKVDKHV